MGTVTAVEDGSEAMKYSRRKFIGGELISRDIIKRAQNKTWLFRLRRFGNLNLFLAICVALYFLGAGLALTLSSRLAHAQEGAAAPPDLVTLDKIGRAGLVFPVIRLDVGWKRHGGARRWHPPRRCGGGPRGAHQRAQRDHRGAHGPPAHPRRLCLATFSAPHDGRARFRPGLEVSRSV